MRIIFIFLFLSLTACSSLKTPTYTGVGNDDNFTSPLEEGLTSEVVEDTSIPLGRRAIIRGPLKLVWPVENPILNRGFFEKKGRRRAHKGLDLKGVLNDPVYAAHDGTVIYVGQRFKGYGKMILIEYDQTWASLYAHLNSFSVRTGNTVRAGELIGRMGRTGRTTGVHLHFELIKNKIPIDPYPLLKETAFRRSDL